MDHVCLLGPTIQKITWHKAGIFKSGSLAFSTLQEQAVTTVWFLLPFLALCPGPEQGAIPFHYH